MDCNTLLYFSLRDEDYAKTERLLKLGVNPNQTSFSIYPIEQAFLIQDAGKTVDLLLAYNLNLNTPTTPFEDDETVIDNVFLRLISTQSQQHLAVLARAKRQQIRLSKSQIDYVETTLSELDLDLWLIFKDWVQA